MVQVMKYRSILYTNIFFRLNQKYFAKKLVTFSLTCVDPWSTACMHGAWTSEHFIFQKQWTFISFYHKKSWTWFFKFNTHGTIYDDMSTRLPAGIPYRNVGGSIKKGLRKQLRLVHWVKRLRSPICHFLNKTFKSLDELSFMISMHNVLLYIKEL